MLDLKEIAKFALARAKNEGKSDEELAFIKRMAQSLEGRVLVIDDRHFCVGCGHQWGCMHPDRCAYPQKTYCHSCRGGGGGGDPRHIG